MEIILQRFANREYRLTQQSIFPRRKIGSDKYAERQNEKYAQAVHNSYVLQSNLHLGIAVGDRHSDWRPHSFNEADAHAGIRALDVIDEFQTKPRSLKKGGWGHLAKPTSFTRNARHRLLEAGAIVDMDCGLNAWEITCTIPGSTKEAFRVVAENTGWIMNELTQIIRRSKCQYWFYVWELQKRGALHLHLCIANPKTDLKLLAQSLERRWWDLLISLSDRTGTDLFKTLGMKTWRHTPSVWQSHVAPIKKSVAAYFSKYAGKSSSTGYPVKTSNEAYTPSRWWGSSRQMKERIKQERRRYVIEVSNSTGKEILIHLNDFLDSPKMIKKYEYSFDLGQSAIGTNLGGGRTCIRYYETQEFQRMQTWESFIWEHVCMMANADMLSNADMGEMTLTDTQTLQIHYKTPTRPQHPRPPLNKQKPTSCKLSKARGTQAKPSLALRAQLVKFLSRKGEESPCDVSIPQMYSQLSLFK